MDQQEPTAEVDGTRPRLAIVYDGGSASPMDLHAALGGWCDLIWVIDSSDPTLGALARLVWRLGPVVDRSGRSDDEVAAALGSHRPGGVIAFSDRQLPTAAALAAALGLRGNPPDVVALLRDKAAQRAALDAAGLPGPRFVRIPASTDPSALTDLVGAISFPLVLKPAMGDSSADVSAVADLDTLRSAFSAAVTRDAGVADFVAEEYLVDRDRPERTIAPYVSVEVITAEGVAVPLAITGKFPLAAPFRESGNFMPHLLSAGDAADVLDLAVAAAERLGVRNGALHVEIKLTPDGPRLIEVNGRVGGGAIDAIFERRHGVSLTELASRVVLGERVVLTAETPGEPSGPFDYEFFLQAPVEATRVRSVAAGGVVDRPGVTEVAVNRSPGDTLDWRDGSQGYLLRVGGVAADREALASIPGMVARSALVEYD